MNDSFKNLGIDTLCNHFKGLDGKPYHSIYSLLKSKRITGNGFAFYFLHVQGSPGAFPASVINLHIYPNKLTIPANHLSTEKRRIACADYMVRAIYDAVNIHTTANRGSDGSGSWQPLQMPQKVLERNLVQFNSDTVSIKLRVSLPGDRKNKLLGYEASEMFATELPDLVDFLSTSITDHVSLKKHCDTVEDHLDLQHQLTDLGLIAFIADGSTLPRESGISDLPLKYGAVPFVAPDSLAVTVNLKNTGPVRGMGIKKGVTTVIGGGFHGKSTLLNALKDGVYPHIPGDGREQVATINSAVSVRAEDGRSVQGVDISGFLNSLPDGKNTTYFSTNNASGSTSEAASIIESAIAGSEVLLIDEDTSATNFLIRDRIMRSLIPEEPITPLLDRTRELFEKHGISTVIVAGGSSDYLAISDSVIAMRNYHPVDMSSIAFSMDIPKPKAPEKSLQLKDYRRLKHTNFNPTYFNERLNKKVAVRIKPLREKEQILEYGMDKIDCSAISSIVDRDQVICLGYVLLTSREWLKKEELSPTCLAAKAHSIINKQGLDTLHFEKTKHIFLARIRKVDLAAAINRIRSLALYTKAPKS